MLALERVSKAYDDNVVLKDFSLNVNPNEILCLLGPSGCGKTTLLHILAGLLPPDSGHVHRPPGRPGVVFQEPRLLPWHTAAENLALGLKACHMASAARGQIVAGYLDRLDLTEAAHLYPRQLSGGMRQRVALGRALAIDPSYLLLDEPFKSLDVGLRIELIRLLVEEWQRRPRPIVFVTHDVTEAALAGHRILVVGPRPLHIVAEITLETPPGERQPGEPDVLQAEARLYRLLGPRVSASGLSQSEDSSVQASDHRRSAPGAT